MIYFCNINVEGNELFTIFRSLLQQLISARCIQHSDLLNIFCAKQIGWANFAFSWLTAQTCFTTLYFHHSLLLHPNSWGGSAVFPGWLGLVGSTLFLDACLTLLKQPGSSYNASFEPVGKKLVWQNNKWSQQRMSDLTGRILAFLQASEPRASLRPRVCGWCSCICTAAGCDRLSSGPGWRRHR